MQKQSAYFVEEREIDIKTMLRQSLKHWRVVLIGAVIGAVLACGVKYKADTAAAQAAINNQIEAANAPEVTIEYLEGLLGENHAAAVWNAAEYWAYIEDKKEYMEKSVWFNLNAYEENAVYLSYQVQSAEPLRMISSCGRYLNGTEMAESIIEEMGLKIETKYVTELLSMPLTDNATYFTVKVCADNKEECEALADCVEKLMGNYTRLLEQEDGVTQIRFVERDSRVVTDETLANTQVAYDVELYNMLNVCNSYIAGFDGNQLQLYKMLLEKGTETGISIYADVNEEDEENVKDTPAVEIDTTIHVKPNVTVTLIGFFAGGIAAYAILMLLYTISPSIHGTDEMKYLFGLSNLGTMNTIMIGKKRICFIVDHWIDRLSRGRKNSLDYEQQLELIVANIRVVCEKQGVHQVFAFGSDIRKIPEVSLKNIQTKLKEHGISIEYGEGILMNPESLEQASKIGAVIVFEVDEKTKCEEIAKELNVCRQSGIKILGAVLTQVF